MSNEDEDRTDHLACAKELLGLIDNLHGDELDQTADLERGASAHALVDIAQSFRRFNSDRSQWYREVLEVLIQAKESEGSLRSRQPAAATSCPVCGNEGYRFGCDPGTELTRTQWLAHHEGHYRDSQEYGSNKTNAAHYADQKTEERFGPYPEES